MEVKKRKPRFSVQEIDVLVDEVYRNRATLFSKFCSTITNERKMHIWQSITESVNEVCTVEPRTADEVRRKWYYYLSDRKKEIGRLKRRKKTDSTADVEVLFTPTELKIWELLGEIKPSDNEEDGDDVEGLVCEVDAEALADRPSSACDSELFNNHFDEDHSKYMEQSTGNDSLVPNNDETYLYHIKEEPLNASSPEGVESSSPSGDRHPVYTTQKERILNHRHYKQESQNDNDDQLTETATGTTATTNCSNNNNNNNNIINNHRSTTTTSSSFSPYFANAAMKRPRQRGSDNDIEEERRYKEDRQLQKRRVDLQENQLEVLQDIYKLMLADSERNHAFQQAFLDIQRQRLELQKASTTQ